MNDDSREWSAGTVLSLAVVPLAIVAMYHQISAGISNGEGLTWDFANFYDAGHKVLTGETRNLYDSSAKIGGEAPQGGLAFFGTPLSAACYAPMAVFPPRLALALFKVQSTLASLVALCMLFFLHRRYSSDAGRDGLFLMRLLAVAASFQPLWEVYHIGGQTTAIVLLAFVSAVFCHMRGHVGFAAALLVGGVALKPGFAPALVLLTILSGRLFGAYVIAFGVALGAVSIGWLGWPLHAEFLAHITKQVPKWWLNNSSLTAALDNVQLGLFSEGPSRFLSLTKLVLRFGLGGTLLLLHVQGRRAIGEESSRCHFDYMASIVICMVVMPVVWEHYLAMLLPLLSFLIAALRYLPRGTLVLVAAIVVACLVQNVQVLSWLNSQFRVDTPIELIATGLLKSLPLGLAVLLLILYRQHIVNAQVICGSAASRHG